MRFVGLRGEERKVWSARLAALEGEARYPLGDDHFSIDHGADYFAFFDRLGEEERWVVVDEAELVATAGGVLRILDDGPAWYLCDLKVSPSHRARHLPAQMGARSAPGGLLRCRRGYGIAMDPTGARGESHPMARRLARFLLFNAGVLGHLSLFSLDAEQAARATPVVVEHRGSLTWLSLAGKKDIVLESTGQPLPLLHAQFGPYAEAGSADVVDGAVHMICVPTGDALFDALCADGFAVSGSATVFHLRMDEGLLPTILSSDI